MKLLKYVITNDTGLAPNPFGRWCTLAVCTPNHMNANLIKGDWIIGHSTKSTCNKLIYSMEVQEILDFNQYFHDPRFQYKKPKLKGKWWQFTGDNIYFKNAKGDWDWIKYSLHSDKRNEDINHPIVFVSKNFHYFGKNSIDNFAFLFPKLIKNEHGISYVTKEKEIYRFIKWLGINYKKGRQGNKPTDLLRKPKC